MVRRPDIAGIKAVLEASTYGIWDTDADGVSVSRGQFKSASVCTGMGADKIDDRYYQAAADAKFIALAHNEMAALLEYIEHCEKSIEYGGIEPPSDADYDSLFDGDDEMYPGEFSHR